MTTLPRITGTTLRTARMLVELTQEELSLRAGHHRDRVGVWEMSSDAAVPAQYQALIRVVDVLESEGVRFSENGVSRINDRPGPITTVIHSEAAA
jgi:hypothetical protein